MKKVLLGLTIMSCCVTGFAQQKMTKEQARSICAQQMAAFTNAVSGSYKKGISFEQFQLALCGGLTATTEGSNQLKLAYNYLLQGTSSDAIIKSNDGKEIAYSLNYLLNLHQKGFDSDGAELFGGKTGTANSSFAKTAGCKWFEVWCLMQSAASWLVMNWPPLADLIFLLTYGPHLN